MDKERKLQSISRRRHGSTNSRRSTCRLRSSRHRHSRRHSSPPTRRTRHNQEEFPRSHGSNSTNTGVPGLPDFPANVELHPAVAACFNEVLTNGLPRQTKKDLLIKYSVPDGSPLRAPKLNEELLQYLPQSVIDQDAIYENQQNQIGVGLSALSRAMRLLVENKKFDKPTRDEFISTLTESATLMADLLHTMSEQ